MANAEPAGPVLPENGAGGVPKKDDYLRKIRKKYVTPDDGFRAVHLEDKAMQALAGPSTAAETALLAASSQPGGDSAM